MKNFPAQAEAAVALWIMQSGLNVWLDNTDHASAELVRAALLSVYILGVEDGLKEGKDILGRHL